jgi:hypothetical protein
MGLIGVESAISSRAQWVSFDAPGPPVPDGDGGYTQGFAPLDPPALYGEIVPATAYALERLQSSTVMATATLLVTVPFHPGITIETRIAWTDAYLRPHTANVVGIVNVDERCRELVLGVVEVLA